jgi:hypothetical protein
MSRNVVGLGIPGGSPSRKASVTALPLNSSFAVPFCFQCSDLLMKSYHTNEEAGPTGNHKLRRRPAHTQLFSPKKARKGLVHFDSGCLDLNTRRSSKPNPTDIGVPILINHRFHAVG